MAIANQTLLNSFHFLGLSTVVAEQTLAPFDEPSLPVSNRTGGVTRSSMFPALIDPRFEEIF